MVSFSQARFGEVDANIAVHQAAAPADMFAANAIQAFGDIGGQIRQGMLQRDLKQELRESGNIIATINSGEDAIRDAVQKKQLDPTTEKFQRLAAAAEQGKISQQRATLEAEVLLRQSISMAPGFADQMRKVARDTLGFDPTAGALNTLYLSGPDATSSRVTQEMKDLEEADALVAGGYTSSREKALELVVGARAAQFQEQLDSNRIKQGGVNAGRLMVIGANRAQAAANDVMLQAMQEIRTVGGVQNIETLRGSLLAQREAVKSKLENEMADSTNFLYQPEAYNQMRSRIDEVFDANTSILDNQDLVGILSRHQDKLQSIIAIEGINLAPDLAIISAFGESAVSSYLEMMAAAGGDPRVLGELMKVNPAYGFLGEKAMNVEGISVALREAAQGALGNALQAGTVDKDSAQTVARFDGIGASSGTIPVGDIPRIIDNLVGTDLPQTALSVIANRPESIQTMTPEQRTSAVANFRNTQQQQVHTMQRNLGSRNMSLAWDGKSFVVQEPTGEFAESQRTGTRIGGTLRAAGGPLPPQMPGVLAAQAGVKQQVDLLNKTMLRVAKDPRWIKELGFDNVNDWANSLMNTVNLGAAEQDLNRPDSIIAQNIPIDQQARLRSAFATGDIDTALEVLTNAKMAGERASGIQPSAMFQQGDFRDAGQGTLIRDASGRVIDSTFQAAGMDVSGVDSVQQETLDAEGFSATVYNDPAGIPTIGYGRNLSANPLTAEDYAATGVDPNTPTDQLNLTKEQAQVLLQRDVTKVIPELQRSIPSFNNLNREQQKALVDMGINLGAGGVRGFRKMIAAIEAGDFETASQELLDSDYARGHLRDSSGNLIRNPDGSVKVHRGLVTRAQMNSQRMVSGR